MSSELKKVYGLDVLRSIAILLVCFGHGAVLLKDTTLKNFPYIVVFDGVDIFFVLSGFLIGSILLKHIDKPGKFSFKELFTFWKRRWFRTLPNYYLFLLINFLIVYFGITYSYSNIDQFTFRFLVFTQNFGHGFYGFFWESWSLAVEEWFYLLCPLILFVLIKFVKPKLAFLITAVLMILFSIFYRWHLLNLSVNDFIYDLAFRKNLLNRFDSIGFGLIAAWLYHYYKNYWLRFKTISIITGIAILSFIIFYKEPNQSFYKQVLFFSLTPLAVFFIFPLFAEWKGRQHPGTLGKCFIGISQISYSMYLLNFLVVTIIIDNLMAFNPLVNYLLFWFLTILLSHYNYKYFELPLMNLRDRKRKFTYLVIDLKDEKKILTR